MKRLRMLVAVLAMGSVAVFGQPAGAASKAHADVVGTVGTGEGMGYPEVFPAVMDSIFALGSNPLCIDNGEHVLKDTEPVAHEFGPDCSLNGSGEIDGHCGNASGRMSGSFRSSAGREYEFTGSFTIFGTTFAFTGTATRQSTNQSGSIAIGGQLVENPLPGGSCRTGTQRSWLFVGTVEIVVV